MTAKTRTLRTPAERAIAALGFEQRRVKKLHDKHDALNADLIDVAAELETAERRLAYVKANPDLPEANTDLPEANTDPIPGVDEGGAS